MFGTTNIEGRTMWSKTAAVAGCLGAVLAASTAGCRRSQCHCSTAMREVLEELVPMFERASGHKVTVSFQSGAVLAGEGQGRARRPIWS